MARAYSQDLRNRVIEAVERQGMSRRAAARRFGVSEASAIRWIRRYRATGERTPAGTGGHRRSVLEPHRDFLSAARAEQPDLTLAALCRRLAAECGVRADTAMLSRFFRCEGLTLKKDARCRRAGPPGRKPTPRPVAPVSGPHRPRPPGLSRRDLGADRHDLPPRLGAARRAVQGQGAAEALQTATFLAALRHDRIEAPCLFDGPINGERFLAYVEQCLAPTLKAGDVVILDNLGAHRSKAVRQAIRVTGAHRLFLPKYSPEFNPIEPVFAKLKTLLRKAAARTLEAICAAVGTLLARFTPQECARYFRNAGYAST